MVHTRTFDDDRPQTLGEEIANAISHGFGVLLALAALPLLVVRAIERGSAADIVGASLFGGAMVMLYLVSTVYHALPPGRAKHWFNRFDHASIFIFIAGSYMPFLLGPLRGPWGWALFAVVWGTAAVGVIAKLFDRLRQPIWSTSLYVAMGWVAVIAAGPLFSRVAPAGIFWLVAGGLSYTLGAVVFMFDSRIKYAHFVWHLFVLGGSLCHFFAALWYGLGH